MKNALQTAHKMIPITFEIIYQLDWPIQMEFFRVRFTTSTYTIQRHIHNHSIEFEWNSQDIRQFYLPKCNRKNNNWPRKGNLKRAEADFFFS